MVAMIRKAVSPRRVASVTKPARKECPPNVSGSSPAASPARFMAVAIPCPESRAASTRSARLIRRNSAPASMPDKTLNLYPEATLCMIGNTIGYQHQADADHWTEGLLKAGLSD